MRQGPRRCHVSAVCPQVSRARSARLIRRTDSGTPVNSHHVEKRTASCFDTEKHAADSKMQLTVKFLRTHLKRHRHTSPQSQQEASSHTACRRHPRHQGSKIYREKADPLGSHYEAHIAEHNFGARSPALLIQSGPHCTCQRQTFVAKGRGNLTLVSGCRTRRSKRPSPGWTRHGLCPGSD